MPEPPPAATDAPARSRFRGLITTFLVIMISIMIVRDILVRRWGTITQTGADVTQRSRR